MTSLLQIPPLEHQTKRVKFVHESSGTILYLMPEMLLAHSPLLVEDNMLNLLGTSTLPAQALIDFFESLHLIASPTMQQRWECRIIQLLHLLWVCELLNFGANSIIVSLSRVLQNKEKYIEARPYDNEQTLCRIIDYISQHRPSFGSLQDQTSLFFLCALFPDLTEFAPHKLRVHLQFASPKFSADKFKPSTTQIAEECVAFVRHRGFQSLYDVCLSRLSRDKVGKASPEELNIMVVPTSEEKSRLLHVDLFLNSAQWTTRIMTEMISETVRSIPALSSKASEVAARKLLISTEQECQDPRVRLAECPDFIGAANFLIVSNDGGRFRVHDWILEREWPMFPLLRMSGLCESREGVHTLNEISSPVVLLILAALYRCPLMVDVLSELPICYLQELEEVVGQYHLSTIFDERLAIIKKVICQSRTVESSATKYDCDPNRASSSSESSSSMAPQPVVLSVRGDIFVTNASDPYP